MMDAIIFEGLTVQEAVLRALEDTSRPLTAKEIADHTGKNDSTVRGVLRTLFKKGEVLALNNQTYCLPGRFPEVVERIGVQPSEEALRDALRVQHQGRVEPSASREEVRQLQSNTPPLLVIEMGGQRIEIGLYMRTPEVPIRVPGRAFTVDVERETELFFDTDADQGHEDT